jgi:hypothetical protein
LPGAAYAGHALMGAFRATTAPTAPTDHRVRACSLTKGTLEHCAVTNSRPTVERFFATSLFFEPLKITLNDQLAHAATSKVKTDYRGPLKSKI